MVLDFFCFGGVMAVMALGLRIWGFRVLEMTEVG